jgi:hypothetical protein
VTECVRVADGLPVLPVPALSVTPAELTAVVPVATPPVGLAVDSASAVEPVVDVSLVPDACEPV